VHDYGQVMWQVGANVDPKRDVLLSEGPLDHLDHAPILQFVGGKIGIDATAKGPSEGYTRGWPEQIRMTEEMRDRVTARWAEYGIGTGAAAANPAPAADPKMSRFARSGRGRT
jgi:4-hydroxy-3-polyprenylbenzoate decarboxylase